MATTVRHFMTRSPLSIGVHSTLAEAHAVMREHKVRHLPVVAAGKLVGVVSEDDLHLMETLPDVKPEEVEVEDAMSPEPYVVAPNAPLDAVALEMKRRRVNAAVVVKDDQISGVFTTVDALSALAALVKKQREKPIQAQGRARPGGG